MENLRDKTILITGGTGFIGRHLCKNLIDHGARIFILTRTLRNSSQNITYIASIADMDRAEPDIIINLAGEPIAQRWTVSAKDKIVRSRLEGTATLIDYIKSAAKKPSLFISASAIGYYGTEENNEFVESTQPALGAPFSRELCKTWEAEALKAEKFGIRTVILRIGAVLEKDGGMLAKLLLPFRLGLGGPISHGSQWLSWIDRDDFVSLILYTIQNPSLQGPINATSPNPVSNKIFSKTLANILNKPCLLRIPAFALRFAYGGMADEIMLAGQKVLPRKALESGFIFLYPTIQASLQKILTSKRSK